MEFDYVPFVNYFWSFKPIVTNFTLETPNLLIKPKPILAKIEDIIAKLRNSDLAGIDPSILNLKSKRSKLFAIWALQI